jgi:hypothetical protein
MMAPSARRTLVTGAGVRWVELVRQSLLRGDKGAAARNPARVPVLATFAQNSPDSN